jgi:glycosyltransferase involved in cell wall biosynthesis
MTQNKGIHTLLRAFYDIVIIQGKTNYKLILKGSNNLYNSQQKIEEVLKGLPNPENLLGYIVFIGHTFTFDVCNELYNIVDLYVSPYMAEGFNLSPLEALTAGRRVLVPKTGSTEQYIQDIYTNGGSGFITYVESTIVTDITSGQSYNHIEESDLTTAILSIDVDSDLDPTGMIEYIATEYSWAKAAESLYGYFIHIIGEQNPHTPRRRSLSRKIKKC